MLKEENKSLRYSLDHHQNNFIGADNDDEFDSADTVGASTHSNIHVVPSG